MDSSSPLAFPRRQPRTALKAFTDLEKVITFLSIEPKFRSYTSLKFVQYIFMKDVLYFQKLKEKLQPNQIMHFINCLKLEHFNPFQVVFAQGDASRKIYFILDGEVTLWTRLQNYYASYGQKKVAEAAPTSFEEMLTRQSQENQLISTLGPYEYFGESALQSEDLRTTTVVTSRRCIFAVMDYQTFQHLIQNCKQDSIIGYLPFVKKFPPFNCIPEESLLDLIHNFEELEFQTNSYIFKFSNLVDCLYLIVEGDVLLQRWESRELDRESLIKKQSLANMGQFAIGQLVGDYEYLINYNHKRSFTRVTQAVAKSKTKVLKIHLIPMIDLLKVQNLLELFHRQLRTKYQNKVPDFDIPKTIRSLTIPKVTSREEMQLRKDFYVTKFKYTTHQLMQMTQNLSDMQRSIGHPVERRNNILKGQSPEQALMDIRMQLMRSPKNQQTLKTCSNLKVLLDDFKQRLTKTKFLTSLNESSQIRNTVQQVNIPKKLSAVKMRGSKYKTEINSVFVSA